ncbi:chemotaxis response regulator protein-glutamate methylesterase [Cohnella lubricantis]|uniref:Protein-glutamate methylesterase/protein-glutamine glutaminase n=1 Tax=Cohnella lubricantis TaxID=2163172 RepID=A0A841TGY7_9BACL|nr:chemotaxis response regulator protein-glutamate methylesterase [Cohnella lubricantis]MBB6679395.1 response regulator [Cohnella lubricantis]MBP2117477.1 two-component system chemotaxis response regulator CheB [Cohnella lubricantis]
MSIFKVLVVDDSPFMRKVFSDFISEDPAFEVAGTASDGMEALERVLALAPDIVTMDLEMPQMNGLEALKRLMAVRPTPVIMISAVTDNGTRDTIRALQYGAIDFIRKPDSSLKLDIRQVGEQLVEKLHIAAEMVRSGSSRNLAGAYEDLHAVNGELPQEDGPDSSSHKEASGVSAIEEASQPSPLADSSVPNAAKEAIDRAATSEDQLPKPKAPSAEPHARQPEAAAASVPPPAPTRSPAPASMRPIAQQETRRRPSPEQAKAPLVPEAADKPPKAALKGKAPAQASPPAQGAAEQPTMQRRLATPPRAASAPGEPDGGRKPPAGAGDFRHLVAIGTSTGGPRALHEVLTKLPADFPAPILIVQHMPPKFTKSLAQRLDSFSQIRVCEAQDGDSVQAGTAYIAPGGKHMALVRSSQSSYRIALTDEEPRSGHKPSVDRLFESLIGLSQVKRHVVIMTGMGSDGAKGMKALRDDGAETTIAEAEQTCIVYGMPRSAVELGAASQVLELQRIAPALVQEVIALKS